MFSQDQITEILKIINFQHILFIGNNVGVDILSQSDIFILEQNGIDIKNVINNNSSFEDMFRFGLLSSALGYKKTKDMDYNSFIKFLRNNSHIKLTDVEKYALNNAKKQASSDIRGLGNKIQKETEQILIEFDQKQRFKYENIISNEAQKNIKQRGSISSLVSQIGHKTKDWARDLGRISDYIMHQAFEYGRAEQILKQYGEDSLVYKNVYEKACKHCVRLYLTNGVNSEPKVFKLKDLILNGNNIGKKIEQWLPIVGPTHPHCRCTIAYKDPNYDWSEKDKSFNKPKKYTPRVKRRSKIRVTIGDNQYNI